MSSGDQRQKIWNFLRQHAGRLGKVGLIARSSLDGTLSGLHRSRQKGFSVEPVEVRPYYRGDDLRYLDWKIYARLDRMFVRQFEQESNIRIYLLVDGSASMDYGPGRYTKWDIGCFLSCLLALTSLRQGDAVGLLVFSSAIWSFIPARQSPAHLSTIVDALAEQLPKGQGGLARLTDEFLPSIRRRSLFVLVSDLLEDTGTVGQWARVFHSRGHDLMVCQVMDRAELTLPLSDPALFYDPESGRTVATDPESIRTRYVGRMNRFIEEIRSACASGKADHYLIVSDDELPGAVRRFVLWRQRRRGTVTGLG